MQSLESVAMIFTCCNVKKEAVSLIPSKFRDIVWLSIRHGRHYWQGDESIPKEIEVATRQYDLFHHG
jgi:hypothetical protein